MSDQMREATPSAGEPPRRQFFTTAFGLAMWPRLGIMPPSMRP